MKCKLDFMSLDSWHESRLLFMNIHENHFMNVYRIEKRYYNYTAFKPRHFFGSY